MNKLDRLVTLTTSNLIERQDVQEALDALKSTRNGFEAGYVAYNIVTNLSAHPNLNSLKDEFLNELKKGEYKKPEEYDQDEAPFKDEEVIQMFINEASVELIQYGRVDDSSDILWQVQNNFQSAYIICEVMKALDNYLPDYPDLQLSKEDFLKHIKEEWNSPLPLIKQRDIEEAEAIIIKKRESLNFTNKNDSDNLEIENEKPKKNIGL